MRKISISSEITKQIHMNTSMSIKCSKSSGGKLWRRYRCGVAGTCGCEAAAQRGVCDAAQRPRRLWVALIKFMATSPLKQY